MLVLAISARRHQTRLPASRSLRGVAEVRPHGVVIGYDGMPADFAGDSKRYRDLEGPLERPFLNV